MCERKPDFSELRRESHYEIEARGEFAGWLGVDYRVPLATVDEDTMLDPQVRLNFQLGAMIGYVGKWDLYVIYAVVDRGDVESPDTTLPLLDGGFDQSQLVFGAARRFDLEPKKSDQALQIVQ